jgi:hypothetical protein
VTLDAAPLEELDVVGVATADVVAVVVAAFDAVVCCFVVETLVAAVRRLLARAGSWPLTRVIVIISQAATNNATAPVTTRRRIMRARWARVVVMPSSLLGPRSNSVRYG